VYSVQPCPFLSFHLNGKLKHCGGVVSGTIVVGGALVNLLAVVVDDDMVELAEVVDVKVVDVTVVEVCSWHQRLVLPVPRFVVWAGHLSTQFPRYKNFRDRHVWHCDRSSRQRKQLFSIGIHAIAVYVVKVDLVVAVRVVVVLVAGEVAVTVVVVLVCVGKNTSLEVPTDTLRSTWISSSSTDVFSNEILSAASSTILTSNPGRNVVMTMIPSGFSTMSICSISMLVIWLSEAASIRSRTYSRKSSLSTLLSTDNTTLEKVIVIVDACSGRWGDAVGARVVSKPPHIPQDRAQFVTIKAIASSLPS